MQQQPQKQQSQKQQSQKQEMLHRSVKGMVQMSDILVNMKGVTKTFGGIPANKTVDFILRGGTVHGLLGENGAGKTTLMNVLFGLYRPDAGLVEISGRPVEIHSPTAAMKLGIGMVHQHFMLVRTLTVTENIMLGLESTRKPLLDTKNVRARIMELSSLYHLDVDPDALISQLSVGQQQRVEILTAIFKGADILILDEPTAVLTPGESAELFKILEKLRAEGKGVILISHKLEEVLSIADEVTILRNGEKTGGCPIDENTTRQDLTRMMVGRDVLFEFARENTDTGKTLIEAQEICVDDDRGVQALNRVSFTIRQGEILGLAGVDGNGQKELCEVLTGLRQVISGGFVMDSRQMTGKPPKAFIDNKIFHIPEDRQKSGLVMEWGIQENLILKNYDTDIISGRWFLKKRLISKQADKLIKDYAIKTPDRGTQVKNLSGGNQQKVILAREMCSNPAFLIVSHPTRGLDVGAMEYVRQRILDEKAKGAATLLVSADLEELFQLSDRIAVMFNGQIMDIVSPDAGIERVGMLMAGVLEAEDVR